MYSIILIILTSIIILYLFENSKSNNITNTFIENIFNNSKVIIFVICVLILTYNLKNKSTSKLMPEIYTNNVDFN